MAQRALSELGTVQNAGPYQCVKNFLTGEALKAQERYAEAVRPLELAARAAPLPQSPRVWRSLSECLRKNGQDELADVAARNASALEKAGEAITNCAQSASLPPVVLNIVVRRR
jgi:Flp pilus assembly protein TadD